MIQPEFNIVFMGEGVGGWGRAVFAVASDFKSFVSKLDMVTAIFLNIFVQDCSSID